MEDVPMYTALDGIFGITSAGGAYGLFLPGSDFTGGALFGVCACDATLLTPSGRAAGRGGGKGDIEMQEVDAWWAW
jgi:hypothetical protein